MTDLLKSIWAILRSLRRLIVQLNDAACRLELAIEQAERVIERSRVIATENYLHQKLNDCGGKESERTKFS